MAERTRQLTQGTLMVRLWGFAEAEIIFWPHKIKQICISELGEAGRGGGPSVGSRKVGQGTCLRLALRDLPDLFWN